jgi:hypothetical protein
MPLDPSIVSNAFANMSTPDVNALMQQRVQGAENVYKIETARQEQAAEAEKVAAQQAAEAMLPAVASAFSDPSDAGLDAATSLLPPEVAEAFAPFMQRLKGIADPKMRMTILRAELAKDEEGKFILSQLEPSANMRLQAEAAERRAALDEQRFALDERRIGLEEAKLNQPETMTPYQQAQIELEQAKLEETKNKETAAETKKRLDEDKRTRDVAFAVAEVEAAAEPGGLIDQATGSYIGNLVDTAAQAFGGGTYGAVANAKMKPVADLVLKLVPRFEGPQSDKDTQSYRDAAGDLANPNLPASVKKAAATKIVDLLKTYSGQFEYSGGEDTGGGQDTNGDGVIDFNDLN